MKILHPWSRFRLFRCLLYGVLITGFFLIIGFRYMMVRNSGYNIPRVLESALQNKFLFVKNYTQISTSDNFHDNWYRMHRARTDWRAMLNPCSDQMAWGTLKSGWGKVNRSSARKSYISYMDIQPSGKFARVFIQTRTAGGLQKNIGGDFWRVFFTGPANVSATVFDHQNGSYEAIALLVETGNYSLQAYLDYSLCDGLRNPPENWFRTGNAQGKYQTTGILGFLDEYLYEPLLAGKKITVEILPRASSYYVNDLPKIKCKKSCLSLWDGHGRWKHGRWWPYVLGNRHRRIGIPKTRVRKGTLWIFGDSLGCRFYRSIANKPLCQQTFASCRCSYNWIYPVPNNNITLGKLQNDDLDFQPEIVLNSLRSVLRHNAMKRSSSLLMLNLGLHYPISINFTTFQKLIDDVIRMLGNREEVLGTRARVIWKTSTSMHKENAQPPRNITHFRFSTEQRVRLFDAYAMSAMCEAGIEVLDVYPLSASYPQGTIDITHYHSKVFFAAERQLEWCVMAELSGKTRPVCME